MKDDLKKLVNMNQGNFIQDNRNKDQAMEEAFVEHPAKGTKRKAEGASLVSWVFHVFLYSRFRSCCSFIPLEGIYKFY